LFSASSPIEQVANTRIRFSAMAQIASPNHPNAKSISEADLMASFRWQAVTKWNVNGGASMQEQELTNRARIIGYAIGVAIAIGAIAWRFIAR